MSTDIKDIDAKPETTKTRERDREWGIGKNKITNLKGRCTCACLLIIQISAPLSIKQTLNSK